MAKDYDHLIKLLLIGDSGVGKSSLLVRFADDTFSRSYIATIGIDYRIKTIEINNEKIKLQIWDTAGQERFRSITSSYYRGTHGVILVYDVTNHASFSNVKRWLGELQQHCGKAPKILVGNKNDNENPKTVSTKAAYCFAKGMKIAFTETSAKENVNVEEAFLAITEQVLKSKKGSNQGITINTDQINLKQHTIKKRKKLC